MSLGFDFCTSGLAALVVHVVFGRVGLLKVEI